MNRYLQRLVRILKHRWLDETDVARALGPAALARLEARVARAAEHTPQVPERRIEAMEATAHPEVVVC
jgi:hypothetical protein